MRIRISEVSWSGAGQCRAGWRATAITFAILSACFLAPRYSLAGHVLNVRQRMVLKAWLAKHTAYRLATDADCGCEDEIRQMKSGYGGYWPKVGDYHPYIATGDFRGNGISDFAVAAIDRSTGKNRFALLVFDGPFRTVDAPPVFVRRGIDLNGKGFFYGPPRPKPYRLVIGPFESDNTCIVAPEGSTYRLDCN